MRKEAPADRERIFSQRLVDALLETVAAGEQAILLMNRRGYAAWLLCRACGESLTCPACSICYTWHRVRNHLECHYCGRIEHLPSVCPRCKDDALQQMGFGTERIENTLRELVPGARVARMDRDTTRGHALTRLLGAFRKRETDILVGTQMVAKGHDFPGVTLVGVLLAETGLRLPDFRAGERTFQLMTQIAGRAGRAELPGRVLVQTYMPEHYALKLARGHSTEAFLDAELGLRQIRLFPPASHLALFRVESVEADRAWETARRLMAQLGSVGEPAGGDLEIQGPRLAPVERIKERWRIQILLRSSSRSTLSHVLSGVMADLAATPVHHKVHVALDVDPHNFL
jgi:primosomal protein N' (replication factor Y)